MSFTSIDNELFNLLPVLTGNELKVLLAVIRQTVGWHRAVVSLRHIDISLITGVPQHTVYRSIKSLVQKGYLKRFERSGNVMYRVSLFTDSTVETEVCYNKYPAGECPFCVTGKVETYCIKCPKYLLSQEKA